MDSEKKSYFHVPKLDFSDLAKPMTEEEKMRRYLEVENAPKRDWRKFVAHIEEHPEALISWDMPMSFSEFARRVKAGEFD